MFLFYFIVYFQASSALLLTTENRSPSRNVTCRYGTGSNVIPTYTSNCEACLATSRNYMIETTLSLTGVGPEGVTYSCLQYQDIEGYHENLVRECRYFSRDTVSGYDDFCIASPYSLVRGSYRACICITNACNLDYDRCIRQANANRDSKGLVFTNTISEITNPVKCYRPSNDDNQQAYSNLTQLCTNDDRVCKNYVFDHGVLCVISVDRNNQIARQTLVPSIYAYYLIKYKTDICNTFATTSNSITFSQCQLGDTVCMCTVNECDKDLQTCQTSGTGQETNFRSISFIFAFLLLS